MAQDRTAQDGDAAPPAILRDAIAIGILSRRSYIEALVRVQTERERHPDAAMGNGEQGG